MTRMILLGRVFFSRKSALLSMLNNLLKLIIFFFIILFSIMPIVRYQYTIDKLLYSNYDALVQGCSEHMYSRFDKDANVTGLVAITTTMSSTLVHGSNRTTTRLAAVYDDNLDALTEYVLTDELFVKKDDSLMNKSNALLLSYWTSKNIKADIGDVVRIEDLDLEYVLAGIYSDSYSNASAIVLGSSHEGKAAKFFDNLLKGRLYGTVYLKFEDIKAGLDDIDDNYYRDFPLYRKYGENYLVEAADDELLQAKSSAQIRTEQLRRTELSFKYSDSPFDKSYAYYIIPIGMMMVCLLTVQENNKRIQLGLKPVAILSISGISKMHIFLYFLFDSFIKTSILQLLTIYITLLIFRAQEIYTPSDLMLGYTLLYIFSILIASVISAHIIIKKLGEEHIMAALNDEDIQEDLL